MELFLPKIFKKLQCFTWNFCKGAMDGVGGSIKRSADSHVLHGQDMVSAAASVSLFDKSATKVILVPSTDVEVMKLKIPTNQNTVKGIMSFKQITWEKGGVCNARRLTCLDCEPGHKFSHYHTTNIADHTRTPKIKVKVSDVYTSDSDNDDSITTPITSYLECKPHSFEDTVHLLEVSLSFPFLSGRSKHHQRHL